MTQQSTPPAKDNRSESMKPSSMDTLIRQRRYSRIFLRLALAGVVGLLLVFGVPYYFRLMAHESTDDAFIDGRIIPISSRVSGHVAAVRVVDNQKVAAGDLLLEIDARDFQIRADAARAMVRNAQAHVDLATSQKGEVEAQFSFAKAALAQARAEQNAVEAKYRQAAADLKRYRELRASNTISPQQLDQAVTTEIMAKAQQDAARSRVATQHSLVQKAEAALKSSEGSVRQAEAQLAARQSEMEQAALNLSYTRIHAPDDGYVAKKSVEAGAFVQAGQSLMAVVSPEVWVTANFKETQLTDMRTGQPVAIAVDTFPGVAFHGHVESIQRGTGSRFSLLPPENATGNYVKVVQRIPVKIVFDQPRELAAYMLVPGMSVVPEVNIKKMGPARGGVDGVQAAER